MSKESIFQHDGRPRGAANNLHAEACTRPNCGAIRAELLRANTLLQQLSDMVWTKSERSDDMKAAINRYLGHIPELDKLPIDLGEIRKVLSSRQQEFHSARRTELVYLDPTSYSNTLDYAFQMLGALENPGTRRIVR